MPAVDLPLERIVRLIDQCFDPFRWRNVAGPGLINKQFRDHADGSVFSVDIILDPELHARVRVSRRGPAYRSVGTAIRLRMHRVRIARTLARITASDGASEENRTGRALLIGG